MQKPVIAVDFDDVLMPFYQGLITFHNQRKNDSIQYENLSSYYLEEILKCDPNYVGELIVDFYTSSDHADIAPLAGTQEALAELKRSYDLDIVTSRPELARASTETWLSRNFAGVFRDLYFINTLHNNAFFTDHTRVARTKADACKEIGAFVLVDDHVKHATDVASQGISVLMPDRPWNQNFEHEGVIRVQSWDEIVSWTREHL